MIHGMGSGERVRWARGSEGIELLEAAFDKFTYDRHTHDTYAIGVTLHGVQRFSCRNATHDSRPGDVMIINPGEVHDGRSGFGGRLHVSDVLCSSRYPRRCSRRRGTSAVRCRCPVSRLFGPRSVLSVGSRVEDDGDGPRFAGGGRIAAPEPWDAWRSGCSTSAPRISNG